VRPSQRKGGDEGLDRFSATPSRVLLVKFEDQRALLVIARVLHVIVPTA